ncbi:MAG: 23S rRNA (guanosine(2251)-2'-O)-methyltransferase RlmB [Candidatus Hydrogenedentota bacterium]
MAADFVYGRIPVLECLKAQKRAARRLILLEGGKNQNEFISAAQDIPVEWVTRKELDYMTHEGVHQGIVLEADPIPLLNLGTWLEDSSNPQSLIVILDSVEDPHNFGAITRSAAACGVSALIFAKDRAAPVSPVSMKSAAGAMEYVDLIQVTNLPRALDVLKKHDYWVAGLDPEGEKILWDADFTGKTGLVIGNEGKGIRPLVRKKCDYLVHIPISGPISSLNASVSAAIALMECVRQQHL